MSAAGSTRSARRSTAASVPHLCGRRDSAGDLLPWAPVLDNALTSLAVDPDGSQILVGGYFGNINGTFQPGAGAVDPAGGTANISWGANIVPDSGSCSPPAIKTSSSATVSPTSASEGTGGGCFDGDFAVNLS